MKIIDIICGLLIVGGGFIDFISYKEVNFANFLALSVNVYVALRLFGIV